jgi:hypothetical protein
MPDIFEQHIKNSRITPFSGSGVVQEIMGMKAGPVRRLLRDMVEGPFETPTDHIVARLATCKLVLIEFKHRKESITEGIDEDAPVNHKHIKGREWTSMLPFTLKDYMEAVEYAKAEAVKYAGLVSDEDGEGGAKRGRSGGTFNKVQEYMLDNPETFDKSNRVDELAKKIAEELDVPETTTVQYIYKCRRLRKQGEI